MESTSQSSGYIAVNGNLRRAMWLKTIPCGLFAMTLLLSCNHSSRMGKESKTSPLSPGTKPATLSSTSVTVTPPSDPIWISSIKKYDHFYRCAVQHPCIEMAVSMAASGPTAKQDDHWGECPAGSHPHPTPQQVIQLGLNPEDFKYADGLCHRDDNTDAPISARPKLPKPQYVPNKKAIWV